MTSVPIPILSLLFAVLAILAMAAGMDPSKKLYTIPAALLCIAALVVGVVPRKVEAAIASIEASE